MNRGSISRLLLILYVAASTHAGYVHAQSGAFSLTDLPKAHHDHQDFKGVHHDHLFHIGIFHFLGHLLETVHEHSSLSNEYLLSSPSDGSKKSLSVKVPVSLFSVIPSYLDDNINTEPSANPSEQLTFLYRFKPQPNSPLRGPPISV